MAVNKYKHWQHICKGNAKWFKKVQQPSSVDKLLIFPHFPPFSLIFPHFSPFSLIFPHFPSFSLIFPIIPFFRGLLDTRILRIWILPTPTCWKNARFVDIPANRPWTFRPTVPG